MNTWSDLWHKMLDYFNDPELIGTILWTSLRIIIIFVAARVIIRIANRMLSHIMVERERNPMKVDPRRARTIGRLIHNLVSYSVNFISIMLILGQLGLNLGPLLAGAGVVGLAIGFGAQSLVKDVITGFFIIFEDQFGVGDIIQVGTYKGTVEEIGIRVTRVRSWTGEVHIIPNGTIMQVTNFSTYNSIAVIDVSIPYETDIDQAVKVLERTVQQIYEANDKIVKVPEVLGVQMIGNSVVKLRVVAECLPNQQQEVMRIMNSNIKKQFDVRGIEIP